MCFHRPNVSQRPRGFTAIELLVTIAIVAILAAIAAPSFTPLIERWRVRQVVEDLQSTLYFARSEAIKRGGNVTIAADATDGWAGGWQVTYTQSNTTTTLQVNAAPTKVDIALANGNGKISVDRWGMFMHSDSTTAALMDFAIAPAGKDTGDASALRLCAAPGGRIAQKKGSDSC